MDIHQTLSALLDGRSLLESEARDVFEAMFAGQLTQAQIAATLALVQRRGVTEDELVGAASVMRRHVTPVHAPTGAIVIDTCGTGGARKTFNVSTAAAVVVAAASPHRSGGSARVCVAKHGNRSRTGRGSAEILEALGVNVHAPPEVQSRCLDEVGVCFCFAVNHHPATRHAAPVRKELAFPTMFNLLGPLTNPAGATRQFMGIYDGTRIEVMARALGRLGSDRAFVLHSDDGLDELAVSAPTRIAVLDQGNVRVEHIDPTRFGVPRHPIERVIARDMDEAIRFVREAIDGEPGPRTDAVVLAAAGALFAAGAVGDWEEGLKRARAALESGAARETLSKLAEISHQPG